MMFASTDASLLLITPLPSTSKVSKSVAANAADEDTSAISAKCFINCFHNHIPSIFKKVLADHTSGIVLFHGFPYPFRLSLAAQN